MFKLLPPHRVLLLLACLAATPGCGRESAPTPTTDPPPATPGLELQAEDYARARSQFRTKLLKRGPAPQRWQAVTPPADAAEVGYPSGDLRLKAWVSRPPADGGKRPAVLFLHGGFAFAEDDWDMARPFQEAGYVVMTPLLRGENGLPGHYSLFYDEVEDVLAAADYLAGLPQVDGKLLYVAGHSVGGTLTLLAALASDRFRAAASFSGSPDQKAFAEGQPDLVPFAPSDPREFVLRSPVAFAADFKCPVRLYYGSEETVFHDSSVRTAGLAKARGLDVAAVSVPGDHFSSVPPAMQQAIAFFQQK